MSQDQQELKTALETGPYAERRLEANDRDQASLVPVSEAIKYRKRAQAAEQHVEELTAQLSKQQEQYQEAQLRLEEVRLEKELIQQLARAGVIDAEAALLLAQKKLKTLEVNEIDTQRLIETLRRERPYLFSDEPNHDAMIPAGPTAGVRIQNRGGISTLVRAARQARESGSRKDMQEYLRLRRSVHRK